MLEAVIFDMDGVISDTEWMYVDIKNETLAQFGIKDVPDDYHKQFVGVTHEEQWIVMRKDFHREDVSVKTYVDTLKAIKANVYEQMEIKPIPGVVDFIKALKNRGYKLAVASSASRKEIEEMVEHFKIGTYFDALSSGTEVAKGKPAPDVYLAAAEKIGVPPNNCMVIEDAPNGAIGAKAAGMYCLGFSYENHPISKMEEADCVFTRYKDISPEYCASLMEASSRSVFI